MRLAKYKKAESAAREIGRRRGVAGRTGGWLYDRAGNRLCHGFFAYARRLVREGALIEIKGGYVIAEDANEAERTNPRTTRQRRPTPAWGSGIGDGRRRRVTLSE